MQRPYSRLPWLLWMASCAAPPSGGADAALAGSGAGGSSASSAPQVPATPEACQDERLLFPGRSPLRRLTRFEYDNTVRDLLGDTTRPARAFPAEDTPHGFPNDADAMTASRLLIDHYFTVAEGIALRAVEKPEALASLVGCDATGDEDACAQAFIQRFGSRAFRRPLEPVEAADVYEVFRQVRPSSDFRIAIQSVVQVILQSPQFLYRLELGTAIPESPGVARLTPHELASRLSYLLWGSMPDDALLARAQANQLGTPEEILSEAQRMAAAPRARDVISSFHTLLYATDRIESVSHGSQAFPDFTPEIAQLLRLEVDQFIDQVVWEQQGTLRELLTSPHSFLNEQLASFYGISNVAGPELRRVELDPFRRAGFLTSAAIMGSISPGEHTNPVARAKYVLSRVTCTPLPSPPPELNVTVPPLTAGMTTRERFAVHSTDPVCAACHAQMLDPIGFGLENFDAAGRWRTSEEGKPIDASGAIALDGTLRAFVGPRELMEAIATSSSASACYVGKWMTFAYGRAETESDSCTRLDLEQALARASGKLLELLPALTQTDAFMYRSLQPAPAEATP